MILIQGGWIWNMVEDSFLFRIIFFSLWALLAIIRGYYYRKNPEDKEKTPLRERLDDLKAEGKVALVLTAVLIPFFLAAIVLYVFAPPWMGWARLPIPLFFQWLGVVIALGSNALFIWVHRTLDRQWSLSLRIKTEHQLITSGPYRYVRHPMYTALGIYTLGMILVSADILLLIFLMISLGYNIHRVDREEQMLIEEFGENRVPSWRTIWRYCKAWKAENSITSSVDKLTALEVPSDASQSEPFIQDQDIEPVREADVELVNPLGLPELIAMADYMIVNNRSLSEFRKTVKDKLIQILNISVKR